MRGWFTNAASKLLGMPSTLQHRKHGAGCEDSNEVQELRAGSTHKIHGGNYMEQMRLKGRIAVVTGADSGIGQATAIAFAEEGADVAITYLHDNQGADSTRRQIEARGQRALVLQADQRDPAMVAMLFEETHRRLGVPTILVNNAGISMQEIPVKDLEIADWDNVIKTNLYGPFYCCQQFIRLLETEKNRPHATIINITSVHEDIAYAGYAAYDSAKGGLRNLTRTLALELAEEDINVVNIAPGMVLTPMNQEALDNPKVRRKEEQSIPVKRAAEPWEIAQAAVYVASRAGWYMHGTSLFIDGGLMQNVGQIT
jgi:glucose 1-dehydrogenase